jgi:photosystem II stability/assembly factor-like uncharacterized protein
MASGQKRRLPGQAAGRKPNRRQRPPATGQIDRRLVLLGAGVVIVAVIAFVAFGSRAESEGEPVAWATLNTADVHALAFAPDDAQHLYFGHHDGLLETRDGGRSWQPASLTGSDAMNVKAADGRIQIAGHDVYLESIDGGATWQPVPNDLPGLDLHAFAVDPGDPDHAWTFAVGFGLFETTDAGRQWTLRQPGNWGYLATYRDADRTILIAAGPEGLVRSLDAGISWESLAYPGAPLAGGIAATRDGSALYAATGSGLRRSTDKGQTWNDTGFDGIALALAIAPEDPMDVVVVDQATRFYRSTDGGATWPPPP